MNNSGNREKELQENDKKDTFVYDTLVKRFEHHIEIRESLDNKANNMIGYITIIIGLLIGLGAFDLFTKTTEFKLSYYFYISGIIALLLSIILSLLCVKISKYMIYTKLEELEADWENPRQNSMQVRISLIRKLFASINIVMDGNKRKVKLLLGCWISLVAGIILLMVFLLAIVIL